MIITSLIKSLDYSFSCHFWQFSITLILRNIMSSYVFVYISNLHTTCHMILIIISVNKEYKTQVWKKRINQHTSVNEKNSPRPPTALKPLSIFESILVLHVRQSWGNSGPVTVAFVPVAVVLGDLQMSTLAMHHCICVLFFKKGSLSSYPQHWNNFCAWWINSISLFWAYSHAC